MHASQVAVERILSGLATCLLALILICADGCSRAVVGGYALSPSKTHCVYGRIYGGYGRSFAEASNKAVRITVIRCGSEDVKLLTKEYSVKGSNLGWSAVWRGDTNVTVFIFEYPVGANQWDISKPIPTNYLLSVTYKASASGTEFLEESVKQRDQRPEAQTIDSR